MTAPKFIFGMLLVMTAVGVWSYMDGVSAGVIALRVVIGAVALQIGYFLFVLLTYWQEARVRRGVTTQKPRDARRAEPSGLANEAGRGSKPFSQ